MIDGSYPPHRTQEHRPSTCWSAGTPECATASRIPTRHTTGGNFRGGTLRDRASGSWEPNCSRFTGRRETTEDPDTEDKTDEGQLPPSGTEPEKLYRDADEVESFGAESPILASRLRALLEYLGITTAPRYRIKEVPRSGRVEFKAIAEIFFRSRILCRHKGPAFRTSRSDAVADAAWQAITSWVRSNKSRLQNLVYYLLPYRKKDQFKANGVKKDIPRIEMVHHQDVAVELSTHLLTAQHEIETLCAQLRNADATIRGSMRMVECQASDLYASDTDTWTATSSV
jgi:hypothetical protein